MTDDVHRWRVTKEPLEAICNVWGCGQELTLDEIERRLNATERFSAKDARGLSKHLRSAGRELGELLARDYGDTTVQNFRVTDEKDELLAYAAALEGDDDLSKLPTQQKLTAEDMDSA